MKQNCLTLLVHLYSLVSACLNGGGGGGLDGMRWISSASSFVSWDDDDDMIGLDGSTLGFFFETSTALVDLQVGRGIKPNNLMFSAAAPITQSTDWARVIILPYKHNI